MSSNCWACNSCTNLRPVILRDGTEGKINACSNCGFEYFSKDHSILIKNDEFEDSRLASAGLDIPTIKEDYDNGYRQSEEYIIKHINKKCMLT